jgi:CBS domain-containing protein
VANITITELDGRSAADIMHAQTSALGGETTVAEARAYFAASSSRRLAVLADDGLYRGALTPADLPDDADPGRRAVEVAGPRATVGPDAPATLARDLLLASEARRIPVVDAGGRFLGIVSLSSSREWFCGTG